MFLKIRIGFRGSMLLLLFALLGNFTVLAQTWTQEFKLDENPDNNSKQWVLSKWGGGVSMFFNGFVKLSTSGSVQNASAGVVWKLNGKSGDPVWDGSKESTIDFRVAVATAGNNKQGATVTLADGERMYQILLKPAAMKTYRITLAGNKALLYSEGSTIPLSTISGVPLTGIKENNNYIYFGDSGINIDGTSTWQFIRWTNEGAFDKQPPVKILDYGFARELDFKLFPDDSRQWKNYNNSKLITDLTVATPANALVKQQRQKGKWKVLPYETDELKGNALSVYASTKGIPVRIPLGVSGTYGVYIGLSTVAGLHEASASGIKAKLGSETSYMNLYNDMPSIDYRRDVIQELFLSVSKIKHGEVLELSQLPFTPGTVVYIRLVPISQNEYVKWLKEGAKTTFKKNIAAIDGHGMLLYNQAKSEADIAGHFRYLEKADYGKWWYQVTGADLVNYPSKIGTIPGENTEDFSRWYDEEYVASVKGLIKNGINSLKVARAIASKQASEFHVMLRAQGWVGSIPFEETFDSKFYRDHPEWRCVDKNGTPTFYMSYAVPEVKQHLLKMFKEIIETCDPDGVGILFNRGAPYMLWEKAFTDQFKSKYKVDAHAVDADDPRIHELRSAIITDFLIDLRTMLDVLGKNNGGKRYKISASVHNKNFNVRLGLDVETWIKKGLLDDIAVGVADIENYAIMAKGSNTSIYPLLTPWDRHVNSKAFYENISNLYNKGAKGIGVWDADMGLYKSPGNLNLREVIKYLGNKELIAHWSKFGQPEPHVIRLTRLGENEYSGWAPNSGF